MKCELVESGSAQFSIEVPYRLFSTGTEENQKPLLVYLHGFHQNADAFLETCKVLVDRVEAYHLFIDGPYVLYPKRKKKPVSEWGRAWYLYDGEQAQFLQSLDRSSRFLEELIRNKAEVTRANRTGLIGYSMGGYLAGYHALQRPKQVDDLVVYGARIKTEVLDGDYTNIFHQNILALHGNADKRVEAMPQKAEIMSLKKQGIQATFETVNEGHEFSQVCIEKILDWLNKAGYNSNSF